MRTETTAAATHAPPAVGLWRRDPPVVEVREDGTRRVVRGGMWPSHRRWWDLTNHVRLLVTGYGGGKTLTQCKRAISLALENAPVPGALVSPTYPMARETLVPTLCELLDSQAYWQGRWGNRLTWRHVQRSPQVFTIRFERPDRRPRAGRILVYSGEDPRKLKGPNLAFAGIDEPFIQDVEVFRQMVVRCRHPRAVRREINLTGTPEQLNWGYDLAEGDLRDQYDVGLVQASSDENLALPEQYLQQLSSMFDDRAAQAYRHGKFVNLASGLVYYAFSRQDSVVELPMPEGAELGCGMDFNVDPMAFTMFWFVRGKHPHAHFFDEVELPNSDTQDACAVLRERYWDPGIKRPLCYPPGATTPDVVVVRRGLRDVYPDSNAGRATNAPGGKTDYDYVREAGFEVHRNPRGNPTRRDRFNWVNNMLRAKDGRVSLTISPRCRRLVKYQMQYAHESMAKQKAMSHLLDARDYPVAELFGSSRSELKERLVHG